VTREKGGVEGGQADNRNFGADAIADRSRDR